MSISVKIVCDSVAPNGKRLTSFELTYPRFIHSELMTHRMFSRNAASSRAIPIEKMIQRILNDPAMPVHWGQNQKGMQAGQELSAEDQMVAKTRWLMAMQDAVAHSRALADLGVHKQIANRITEPFQHMVTLVSATEFANFFHLRFHKAAQPEFQALASMMYAAYTGSQPKALGRHEWHLPYIRPEDRVDALEQAGMMTHDPAARVTMGLEMLKKVSVGRCARTSYVNQDGVRSLQDDCALHDRLYQAPESGEPGHWSPFEHVARAEDHLMWSGNFCGFTQYRKLFPNENLTTMPRRG